MQFLPPINSYSDAHYHQDLGVSTRCKYRHAVCTKPRVIKRNGSLHNLCKEHRDRANRTQQLYQQRKRLKHYELIRAQGRLRGSAPRQMEPYSVPDLGNQKDLGLLDDEEINDLLANYTVDLSPRLFESIDVDALFLCIEF